MTSGGGRQPGFQSFLGKDGQEDARMVNPSRTCASPLPTPWGRSPFGPPRSPLGALADVCVEPPLPPYVEGGLNG